MNEKRWEKQRRFGFVGFVVVMGFVGLVWGVIFYAGLTFALADIVLPHPLVVIRNLSAFMALGVWTGVLVWFFGEWRYRRQLRKSGREPTPPGTGDPDAG